MNRDPLTGPIAQRLGLRLSTKRTRFRIMCSDIEPWTSSSTLHCSSSLSCVNEYLAIDRVDMCRAGLAGCFQEKLRRCLIEQVCQGRKG